MKLKVIQMFILAYIVLILAKFAVKEFYFSHYADWKPFFDGVLLGSVVVCVLYFARIYITAWLNVKKEARQKNKGA